jgi:hypothetical protein
MPLYEYFCTCGAHEEKIFSATERPATIPCPKECGKEAEYHMSAPAYFKLAFDQNGRLAYKYDLGNGKQFRRSATRERYEHTIGNKPLKEVQGSGSEKAASVYTKRYGEHVATQEKLQAEKRAKIMKEVK